MKASKCGMDLHVTNWRSKMAASAALYGLFFSVAAHACTVCHSTIGRQVQAGIFNGHFIQTLGFVIQPWLFLGVAMAVVYFGMPDLESAATKEQAGHGAVPGARSLLHPIERES